MLWEALRIQKKCLLPSEADPSSSIDRLDCDPGKRKLFSEQQMMDCSWGYGLNKACDGGDYDAAMDYLKLAGGPMGEQEYEYLGADGFCKDQNYSATASSGEAAFEVSYPSCIN